MNWRTFYFYFLILIPLAMSAIIGCQKHAAKTSENQNINGEQIAPQDTDSDLFPSGLEGTLALFPVKEGAASGSLSGIPQGKSGYVQFKNASIDFNPTSLELKLQVTVVTGHESQLIKLIGYMNETGRVDLEEAEKRSDGLDLRAIGQCLDPPKCPSGYVFVDVRYRENGVDREQQFVSVRAADEVSEKKSSESAPCDEFTGCAGKFVGHRVDKDYYKPLCARLTGAD